MALDTNFLGSTWDYGTPGVAATGNRFKYGDWKNAGPDVSPEDSPEYRGSWGAAAPILLQEAQNQALFRKMGYTGDFGGPSLSGVEGDASWSINPEFEAWAKDKVATGYTVKDKSYLRAFFDPKTGKPLQGQKVAAVGVDGMEAFAPIMMAVAPGVIGALGKVAGGATMGAVTGGLNAFHNEGNVLEGALKGGLVGGAGGALSQYTQGLGNSLGLDGAMASGLDKTVANVGKALVSGKDPTQALVGGGLNMAGSALGLNDPSGIGGSLGNPEYIQGGFDDFGDDVAAMADSQIGALTGGGMPDGFNDNFDFGFGSDGGLGFDLSDLGLNSTGNPFDLTTPGWGLQDVVDSNPLYTGGATIGDMFGDGSWNPNLDFQLPGFDLDGDYSHEGRNYEKVDGNGNVIPGSGLPTSQAPTHTKPGTPYLPISSGAPGAGGSGGGGKPPSIGNAIGGAVGGALDKGIAGATSALGTGLDTALASGLFKKMLGVSDIDPPKFLDMVAGLQQTNRDKQYGVADQLTATASGLGRSADQLSSMLDQFLPFNMKAAQDQVLTAQGLQKQSMDLATAARFGAEQDRTTAYGMLRGERAQQEAAQAAAMAEIAQATGDQETMRKALAMGMDPAAALANSRNPAMAAAAKAGLATDAFGKAQLRDTQLAQGFLNTSNTGMGLAQGSLNAAGNFVPAALQASTGVLNSGTAGYQAVGGLRQGQTGALTGAGAVLGQVGNQNTALGDVAAKQYGLALDQYKNSLPRTAWEYAMAAHATDGLLRQARAGQGGGSSNPSLGQWAGDWLGGKIDGLLKPTSGATTMSNAQYMKPGGGFGMPGAGAAIQSAGSVLGAAPNKANKAMGLPYNLSANV